MIDEITKQEVKMLSQQSNSVVQLVSKTTATEEALASDIVDILQDLLKSARAGELTSLVVICGHRDHSWSHEQSGVMDFAAAIGRLEIVKLDWAQRYIKAIQETADGSQ